MIPNLDQLLIVCGIALVVVAAIVALLIKLPNDDTASKDKFDE